MNTSGIAASASLVEKTQDELFTSRGKSITVIVPGQRIALRLETRRRIDDTTPRDFVYLNRLDDEGQTDYIAFLQRFDREGVIGEMDCIYTQWSTARPGGFTETELAALRRLVPLLALALKSASLARVAQTLAEVYLGRDAGTRVLQGRIVRGVADDHAATVAVENLPGGGAEFTLRFRLAEKGA